MKYLLDTLVISELGKPRPNKNVVEWVSTIDEQNLFLSVLTFGELIKGITKLPESARKKKLQSWIEEGLRPRFEGRVLPVSQGIAGKWGEISGEAERKGEKLPVIDSLIGATALVEDLVVVTRNTKDIGRTGARVFNPWMD